MSAVAVLHPRCALPAALTSSIPLEQQVGQYIHTNPIQWAAVRGGHLQQLLIPSLLQAGGAVLMLWSNGVQREPCTQQLGLSPSSCAPNQCPLSDHSQRGAELGDRGHSPEQEGGEGHTGTHHQG